MAVFDTIYTVKRTIGKEEFLRAVMIALAKNSSAPNDICTAKFGEVRETTQEILELKGHVETDYSASIGYDRQVTYYENGNKKTRTETDWRPHSGHIAGDAIGLALNEGEVRFDAAEHDRLVDAIKGLSVDDFSSEGSASVCYGALESTKKICEFQVNLGIDYPGDRQKDKSENSVTTVTELLCWIFPSYEVDFEYKGKTYTAKGFAAGNPAVKSELPPNNVDIKGTVAKETKPLKIAMIAAWISFGIFFFVTNFFDLAWMWSLIAVSLIGSIVVTVVRSKKMNKRFAQLTNENNKVKLEDLKAGLAANSLEALSEDEEENMF